MTALGDSLRLLRARGFRPVAAKGSRRSFEGALHCAKGPVLVKLSIEDWDFLEYPGITVVDRPHFLPELTPHLDVLGGLCYFARGAVTLDRYDPATALAQCINQATAVLDRIASDPSYRVDDMQDEFLVHWEYGQFPLPWTVFLGDIEAGSASASYFILSKDEVKKAFIACDAQEARRLAGALEATVQASHYKCWLFETKLKPSVPRRMPQNIKELFLWLRSWDRSLSTAIQKVLGEKDYLKQKFVAFAVKSPVGWIGFGFDLDHVKALGHARNPKGYRNFLHNAGGSQRIFRMALREVGSQFVHSRNLSFPDLRNKRVTVVGCGAIGSFLAAALIRMGAGTGKLGLLKLIDPELLGPENLGRHVLGYPDLQRFKASALREELLRQFPHSKIDAYPCDVKSHQTVFAADFVVDATGEESVSEYLNHLRLKRASLVPILHAWIRGNGEAVQALWADTHGFACYRCLLTPDPQVHRKERFRLLKEEPLRRSDGCRAFTPYAVSAPMHAAALAVDMVCAWLQGDPTPRFRTRSLETADVYKIKNQNPPKMSGCPACGHP